MLAAMAVSETPPSAFIRPDGKEKVTGAGRYTADLNLTGQLHAKFRYADHTHARIVRIDAARARAIPGVLAVLTHEDVPDVLYGQLVQDRRLFAKEKVRFEADIVAAVAALTPEIARRAIDAIEVEYEPLPALSDLEAALADDAPLIHEDWRSYQAEDDEQMGRNGNVLSYSTVVKGDADTAMTERRRRREGSLCHGRVPRRPDRAARHPRPVARRPRHYLDIDAGAVCGPERRGPRTPDPGVPRAHRRAAAGRRLRLEVRLPLRGARRGTRARCGPAGQARLFPPGGVHRTRPPPRGHGHRARDGRPARRDTRRAAWTPGARRRGVLRRRRFLRAARGDACLRPVRGGAREYRVDARLHEQPAIRFDSRPDGPAGLLGARAAHRRACGGARVRPRRATATHADR